MHSRPTNEVLGATHVSNSISRNYHPASLRQRAGVRISARGSGTQVTLAGKNEWPRRMVARALLLCLTSLLLACGAMNHPPNPNRPRGNEPPGYPVPFTASRSRQAQALAAWDALSNSGNTLRKSEVNPPQLDPVTSTVLSLTTPGEKSGLKLPAVNPLGNGDEASEQAIRESLRRFIVSAAGLIGAQPSELSLVQRVSKSDMTEVARYRQEPFPYPLRGGYGNLEIDFTSEGQVNNISSTAIPDSTVVLAALRNIDPRLSADEAQKRLRGHTANYTDGAGNQHTVTADGSFNASNAQLVVYPLKRSGEASSLEFHVAWEFLSTTTTNDAVDPTRIYVDAVTGEILGAQA